MRLSLFAKNMWKVLFLGILVSSFTGCGLKKNKGDNSGDIIQVFVQGNPEALVDETDKNSNSFITLGNKNEFDLYKRGSVFVFSEKEFFKKSGKRASAEEGNEPSDGTEIKKVPSTYTFSEVNSTTFLYKDNKSQIDFEFTLNSDSTLDLQNIYDEGKSYPAKVLHYSISPDKSRFSFLITIEHEKLGQVLISTMFYKNTLEKNVSIKKTNSSFKYIAGPGIKSAWKLNEQKQVKIDVCPSVVRGITQQYIESGYDSSIRIERTTSTASMLAKSSITSAIKKWEQPFRNSGSEFSINLQFPSTCKPFSDVNQNAIYWVSQYLTLPTNDFANPGVAALDLNYQNAEIIGSDILLFESEINKLDRVSYSNYEKRKITTRTLSHEVGHFLGLDHNFQDKNSIMSYEDIHELGYYDREAITELYSDQLSDEEDNVLISRKGSANGSY
jgi:hypothetical protein